MLLDASHRRWIVTSLVLLVIATLAYVPYASGTLRGPRGGSWPGLAYGAAGLALMIYAGVLGLRRQVPTWRVGRATTWMKGHLWLGLLSYPLVLFHSGFSPGSGLTLVLMILFTAVVLSGVYGIVLQQILPRLMLSRLPLETVYEQIDSIVAQLRAEADALVEAAAGPLPVVAPSAPAEARGGGGLVGNQAFVIPSPRPRVATGTVPEGAAMREIYLAEIRPYLVSTPATRLAAPSVAAALFHHLHTVMPPTLHETVQELEAICDERRQLAQQKRLHHWLHGWLFVHAPLSMALVLLSVVHAVISVRY